MLYYMILYYIILHYFILHYTILYDITLYTIIIIIIIITIHIYIYIYILHYFISAASLGGWRGGVGGCLGGFAPRLQNLGGICGRRGRVG